FDHRPGCKQRDVVGVWLDGGQDLSGMRGSRRVSLEHNFSGSEGESSRDRVPMGCQVVFSRWNYSHPGFRGPTPGGFRRSARNVGACCRAPLLPALQTRSYGSTSGETIPEKFSSFHFLLHIVSKQNRGVSPDFSPEE